MLHGVSITRSRAPLLFDKATRRPDHRQDGFSTLSPAVPSQARKGCYHLGNELLQLDGGA